MQPAGSIPDFLFLGKGSIPDGTSERISSARI